MKNLIRSGFLVLRMSMGVLLIGCAPASTPTSLEPLQTNTSYQPENTLEVNMPPPTEAPQTIAEIEKLVGFDVKEPSYLPTGVSFDFATYQKSPNLNVILHFKLVHEIYGDMGAFFQIIQEPQAEAIPNSTACGVAGNECEIIQIGDLAVRYRLNNPTESLMWDKDGVSFQLSRTAGEPNKIYKEELLNVAVSMK